MRFFIAALLCNLLWMPAAGLAEAEIVTPKMRQTAEKLAATALQDTTAYDLVESLTTEIGPRLAGTEAEARARDWAVKKLKQLGFKNVRIEPFEVPLWQRGVEKAEITSPFPQPLYITTLGGSVATPPEGVEGDLVSFPSLAALQAVRAGSLRGKIVFVDQVMTRTQDGSGYGVAVQKRRETAFAAHKAGAVGALIRSVGTSSHRFAHTGQMKAITDTSVGPSVPSAALSAPDADQLARALSRDEPLRLRLTLTPQTQARAPSGNVIAEIPGRERPDEIVLIGAHLDSWDQGTGAVDDGAGVGIVTGAAKVIMDNLRRAPKRTIRVVYFGAEEVGLVGAKAYAEAHSRELENHIVGTESDFGADKIWRFDTRIAEAKLPVAKAIGDVLLPLGIGPGNNEASGGPDMKYVREAGVPVVTLLQNGWDYFDLHHTPNDTLDKIDPAKLAQNVAAYAAFVYLVAEMDEDFRE
ncbi:M20/M25/M40 family metallo-hydrolase [Exilibacterium tricleocarpae]|uniref:Carboxypeptidase Q n=1 Tax=Exilibacterium tricleocarpae TaxID=2591008 RepID=A0A545SS48_9GAMM|nr:M20/M25/M40 family metallo-hydrolase [Exilibacterium tricleocarpae]TQV67794.1 M20/M25/M40 family metallo-hydrolase [Exilibacterium tricleocarpae]